MQSLAVIRRPLAAHKPAKRAVTVRPSEGVIDMIKLAVSGSSLRNIFARTGEVIEYEKTIGGYVQQALIKRAQEMGIKGLSLANLLATVEAESGFKTRKESHRYSPTRAREMFSALAKKTDAQIIALVARGEDAFFETVYGYTTTAGRRLGNIKPGDGALYPGRGVFQITGRDNYTRFSAYSGIDVVRNPDFLVLDLGTSVESAIWFWSTQVIARRADKDIIMATKVVNPYLPDVTPRVHAAKAFAKLVA